MLDYTAGKGAQHYMRNKTLVRFLKLLENHLPIFLISIFMMTAMRAAFDVICSILIKNVFDIAQRGQMHNIVPVLLKNVIAGVLVTAAAVAFMKKYNDEAKRGSLLLKRKVFDKSLKLPMQYYDKHHSGEVISRLVYETDKASAIYSSRLRRVLAPVISVVVYIAAMLVIHPAMTVTMLLLNVLLLLTNTLFSRQMKTVGKQMAVKNADMTEKLCNMIDGAAVCKIYDVDHTICRQYKETNVQYVKSQKKQMLLTAGLEAFTTGFDLLCVLMFLVVGIIFLQNGMATVGQIAGIYTMYGALSSRFLQLGKNYPELVNCIAYAERIFAFLNETEETAEQKCGENCAVNEAYPYAVLAEGISFQYDKEHPIFHGKTVRIPAKKNIAVTGTSGCGKSTLAKLLLGFYTCEKGDIKLFGTSMDKLGIAEARNLIAYVPQEPYLFEVSIAENIAYGRSSQEVSMADIVQAAKMANAHDFILNQKDGYETMLLSGGQNLSGGERQRIALARAILKKAPIMLLDEATSALDNESERLIWQTIEVLRKDKTIITIAHRTTTIEQADMEIMVG